MSHATFESANPYGPLASEDDDEDDAAPMRAIPESVQEFIQTPLHVDDSSRCFSKCVAMPIDTSNSFKRSKVSHEVLSSSSHDLLSCISSNSSSRDFLKHASHTYSSQLGLLGLDNSKTATTHAESGDWVVVESIVDSGAARSVRPIHFCDSFGTQKPPSGVVEHFKTAAGAR